MSKELHPADLPFGVPLPPRPPREVAEEQNRIDTDGPYRFEIGIKMADGVELAADVYLPAASERPAPAVVVGTPYDKTNQFEPAEPWQQAGYAAVIYDVRGRGKSEGEWLPQENEPADAYEVVEWVAAQEWCDGKVGVTGISYLGGMVWRTLSSRPPHLVAAISTAPEGRWQEECPYQFGCLWLYYEYWLSLVRRRIFDRSRDVARMVETLPVSAAGELLDTSSAGWQEILDHDTLDEVWAGRRFDGEYDYDVPVLHVGGWFDRDAPTGLYHHYEQMLETSPARDRQWLIVGPWSHGGARDPEEVFKGIEHPAAGVDMTSIHIRFFDRFLKGIDNGADEEPRVRLYDPGSKRWEVRESWRGGTETHDLFLAPGGDLELAAGEAASASYRYDPMNAPGLRFELGGAWEPGIDLTEMSRQDGLLVFTSAELEEDLTMRGWGEFELFAATDGEDTDWHVKVGDLGPDERLLQVSWGCLRASYGDDAKNPRPVTPNETRRYSIELVPAFHTFKAGHRIRVLLSSADFPFFARSMNRFG
ncbi:MAG TPA: CocE/NonD family hydrolase, partial [Solirubrobacterales bacterium]|nr:CocE/NonD family hydrolase [Solirubrobacterales bacterium]